MNKGPAAQRGAALIVSLIMLTLITLLAITSFRLGRGDMAIVANMQQRNQTLEAAQGAIEQALSTTQFLTTPANAIANPCGGTANTTCTDVNGDGVTDITTTVALNCVAIVPIATTSLNLGNSNDAGCTVGAAQDFGVQGGASNSSLCSNSVWDAQATAVDAGTSAQFVINEGVAVRVPATTVCP